MGTFTVATGFGMLLLGLLVMTVIGFVGLIVINSQQKQKGITENKSDIAKQLERLRR